MLKVKRLLYSVWCYLTIIPTYIFVAHMKVIRKIVIWSGDDGTKMAYSLMINDLTKSFTTKFKL